MPTLAYLATAVAALLGSMVGMILVLPFGLVVSEVVIFPVAAAISALLAALCGGWAATGLAPDRSRTRLLPAVGASEVVAVLVAMLLLAYLGFSQAALPRVVAVPPLMLGTAAAVVLAVGATLAAWRFRSAEGRTPDDVRLTLVLLALGLAGVLAAFFLASLAGLTGA